MTITPFAKVQVGDLIQTTKFGSWTLLKKNDYGKKSREWDHCEGWFLVFETRIWTTNEDLPEGQNKKWMVTLDLWSPEEKYWCDIVVYLNEEDTPTDFIHELNPQLLTHIPCVTETK